ncbi:MAG TPA: hypothetical protein PKY12_10255 [Catalimonadaceae bacterium]|nr:hypothetical protein [Catalimonadaceae bacterium]
MKKLLTAFTIGAGIVALSAQAQDCKYFKEGTVKATGEPFKESRNVLVKTYAFQLRKEGTSKWSCSLEISIPGTSTYSMTPKDTLYLSLENEEVIKLVPDKVYTPTKKAAMNGITSLFVPNYGLTKEILEKLAASPVVKVRITLDKPIDGPAKKAEAQEIMKMAGCMMKE